MALHSVPTPTRTFDSRHTADDCAFCAAFCTGVTTMVVNAGSCDGLREKDLVAQTDLTRGIFSRHMGDMQRCLVTTYVRMADELLTRFEDLLAERPSWDKGMRDGIIEGVRVLDEEPGRAFFYFVAADRSRDPVMWLERRVVQERFVHALAHAPFEDPLDEIRSEMFSGALQSTIRDRLLADGGFGDYKALTADVEALLAVFHPARD